MPRGDVETVYADGQWTNWIEGDGPSHHVFESRNRAVAEGRRLAKVAGVEHVVKDQDGKAVQRTSYRDDPRPIAG